MRWVKGYTAIHIVFGTLKLFMVRDDCRLCLVN